MWLITGYDVVGNHSTSRLKSQTRELQGKHTSFILDSYNSICNAHLLKSSIFLDVKGIMEEINLTLEIQFHRIAE